MKPGITVVIPTIPRRKRMLDRALASVRAQTLQPADILVELDQRREGAAPTRNRALAKVETEWIAWLDDDDTFYPNHLETLMGVHERTGASICWSWFDGNRLFEGECRSDLHPDRCHRHRDFSFDEPHIFGISYLIKTELAQQCHFPEPAPGARCANEDWGFILQLIERTTPEQWAHTPEITWTYRVHGTNTSGLGR